MTDHTAMDNRPDVDIRMRAVPGADPRVPAAVVGEANCRYCTETLLSPDPRTLVKWADDHESSQSHILCKVDMQSQVPVAPPEHLETVSQGPPGDLFGDQTERPPMNTPWYSDDDMPYPPTHPKGQHALRPIKDQPQA
jgi:hypothetical protein